MSSSFLRVFACIKISLFFNAELYSIVRIDHILFIHSPTDGHLRCFHLLATVSNAAMNVFEFLLSILLGTYPEAKFSG